MSLSGVTHSNLDGVNRQFHLKRTKRGSRVRLVREPDNRHDRFAVRVVNSHGNTIGYLPSGDRRMAEHLDRGGKYESHVVKVTGGPNFLQMIFGRLGKNYGCVLEITKGDFDWKAASPWMDADRKINKLLKSAMDSEKNDPLKAIKTYQKAIAQISALDSNGPIATAWRTTVYPINRLSMLLDKQGMKVESLKEIQRWRIYPDRQRIPDADLKAVENRLRRLQRPV
jgi:hypothetical protein